MRFNESDKAAIEAQVARFEQATGTQAVVCVVDRCDGYPEVPWRAFALGAALSSLALWALPLSGALFYHSTTLTLVAVLGTGAAAALLTVFAPVTGRWLLPLSRRRAEVRQYAQALFLQRELFDTQARSALLILVGLFERCGVILADTGLHGRFSPAQLEADEARLNAALASDGDVAGAVDRMLGALQVALQARSPGPVQNELADAVIRERGH
jgi:putative membrane protein